LYLEKGIQKMKDKDWKNIMGAVANITGTSLKKGRAPVTEEDAELSWESELE
jgi:predicted SprT family Zn-dependent metalloprotease